MPGHLIRASAGDAPPAPWRVPARAHLAFVITAFSLRLILASVAPVSAARCPPCSIVSALVYHPRNTRHPVRVPHSSQPSCRPHHPWFCSFISALLARQPIGWHTRTGTSGFCTVTGKTTRCGKQARGNERVPPAAVLWLGSCPSDLAEAPAMQGCLASAQAEGFKSGACPLVPVLLPPSGLAPVPVPEPAGSTGRGWACRFQGALAPRQLARQSRQSQASAGQQGTCAAAETRPWGAFEPWAALRRPPGSPAMLPLVVDA